VLDSKSATPKRALRAHERGRSRRLFAAGGLCRDTTVSVSGSTVLAIALPAEGTQEDSCAVVAGLPEFDGIVRSISAGEVPSRLRRITLYSLTLVASRT
jgi:hypothetical protein